MDNLRIFDENFKKLISQGVQVVHFENLVSSDSTLETAKQEEIEALEKGALFCSYCKTEFINVVDQREHYKSDWHRYNLKQNLSSKEYITEEQFNDKTGSTSESSESESDQELFDKLATVRGKIFLKNSKEQVFCLYKCLLYIKKEQMVDNDEIFDRLDVCSKGPKWCILMLGGGHFAGAVFNGMEPILHKTFHCYTVRAGQGSAQGSRDNKSGGSQPKSAGASLRRYNEQALIQHVNEILQAWKSELELCNLIVYRASGPYNRAVLFDGKPPLLDKTDHRLRTIPFSTRKATFKEVKRVHDILTAVTIYSSKDQAVEHNLKFAEKRNKTKTSNINRAKSRENQPRSLSVSQKDSSSSEDEELLENLSKFTIGDETLTTYDKEISFQEDLQAFDDSLTPQERKRTPKKKKSKNQKIREREEQKRKDLYNAIKMGHTNSLKEMYEKYLEDKKSEEENLEEIKKKFVNQLVDASGNSLLHVACMFEAEEIIDFLLKNDANPCLKNKHQQTPYTCTQVKEIREILKQFAKENPDKYDYNKAQIHFSTATPEEIAEKKRALRQIKREKQKIKDKEKQRQKHEEREQERFLQLSDREKRALAAERRMANQTVLVTNRCFLCASDMTGKVPFEYLENKFCSTACVKAHRMKTPTVLS